MAETFLELEILRLVLEKQYTLAATALEQMTARELSEFCGVVEHLDDLIIQAMMPKGEAGNDRRE